MSIVSNNKGVPLAHVYINCSEYLRTGKISVAVGMTANGVADIDRHIAQSNDLFHLRVFFRNEPPQAYISHTENDVNYLSYILKLAVVHEQWLKDGYEKTIYTQDKRGRIDND